MSESMPLNQQAAEAAARNAELKIDEKTGLVFNSVAEQMQAESEKMGTADLLSAADVEASAKIYSESAAAAEGEPEAEK